MSKDLWFIEYERACDDFADDEDEAVFNNRLLVLGFTPDEIRDEIAAAKGEM